MIFGRTDAGLFVPESKPEIYSAVLGKPEWERFNGNNHLQIANPKVRYGGAVCFGEHIGRELSTRLWDDLMFRLCIRGLCIYGPNDEQWTIGWGPGHCCLQLDEDDCVEDIQYVPRAA